MKYISYCITCIIFQMAIAANPLMKEYFIESDGAKCSLISLSADISVSYETNQGNVIAKLSFENASLKQQGICSLRSSDKYAQFNISLNENEKIVYNLENVDSKVILNNVTFEYKLPNVNFPNAKMKGTVEATSVVNQTLSTISQFYQCLSATNLTLSNGVIVSTYAIKLKVFNVMNSSFGSDFQRCAQDIISSTNPSSITSSLTTVATTTSVKTTESTSASTKPTESTSASTKPTESTSASTKPTESTSASTKPTESTSASTKPAENTTISINTTTHSSTNRPITTVITTRTTNNPRTTTISTTDPKFEIKTDSTVCLLMQGQITVTVGYEAKTKDDIKLFPITSLNRYTGTCSANEDNVSIYFAGNSSFSLSFTKNGKSSKLNTLTTHVILSPEYFPDAKNPGQILSYIYPFDTSYAVDVGKGYSCITNLTLGNSSASLNVKDFKFEAFRNSNSTEFSSNVSVQCSNGLTIGQIVSILLFGLTLAILLGLSLLSLIKKCARYYRYQKVQMRETF